MINALLVLAIPVAAVAYICLSVKIGFKVAEATEGSGFGVGYYMMTVVGMLALPPAIFTMWCS